MTYVNMYSYSHIRTDAKRACDTLQLKLQGAIRLWPLGVQSGIMDRMGRSYSVDNVSFGTLHVNFLNIFY